MEKSPSREGVKMAREGGVCCTNHPTTEEIREVFFDTEETKYSDAVERIRRLIKDPRDLGPYNTRTLEGEELLQNSIARCRRLTDFIGKRSLHTLKNAKALLRTHGEGGLCRCSPQGHVHTQFGILVIPRERMMQITIGIPCMDDYIEYSLNSGWKLNRSQ